MPTIYLLVVLSRSNHFFHSTISQPLPASPDTGHRYTSLALARWVEHLACLVLLSSAPMPGLGGCPQTLSGGQ